MFKNWRTSTKLVLLCGMFVGAIILATYGLIEEKQISIEFVRKELVGARYLEALRVVYAVILAERVDAFDDAQPQASVDAALGALAKAEVGDRWFSPYGPACGNSRDCGSQSRRRKAGRRQAQAHRRGAHESPRPGLADRR